MKEQSVYSLVLVTAFISFTLAVTPAFAISPHGAGHSDLTSKIDHHIWSGDILVSHPWAEPVRTGGDTRLFLVLENDEAFRISLVDVKTPVSDNVELQFDNGGGEIGVLSSRVIEPEETLDVGSKHMWFSLTDVKTTLGPGDTFPVHLVFNDNRSIEILVRVYELADSQNAGR